MKYFNFIISTLIVNFILIRSSEPVKIQFAESEKFLELEKKTNFSFIATYNKSKYKYLYLYQKNYIDKMNINKALFKIYFKEIQNEDSIKDSSLNYLNSTFSSLDSNSGLFIKLSDLKYEKAFIFIHSYEICNFRLVYRYSDKIDFPPYFKYTNFQLNQFILEKGETVPIEYEFKQDNNDYLLILSKTSLKNIEVKVEYNKKDVTKERLAYLYPNGCSVFLDRQYLKDKINLSIKNKNPRKEILLLGYMHHIKNEIFTNEVVNGLQLYIEGNKENYQSLLISGKSNMIQYFSYQTYNKDLSIDFLGSDNSDKGFYSLLEYNYMFPYTVDFDGKMRFIFESSPNRSSLYIQYLDYSDIKVAQSSLQALVTGIPKYMIIPSGKSIYHFLPKERNSTNFYYYLKARTSKKMYVSFEECTNYPQNCTFEGKRENAVEIIPNIGLWYILPRNKDVLQLIYIYCENECAYDILMTYDDDDPLFLFPDNDYTRFISNSNKDMYALPVFEYFEKSKVKMLYIDLTIISGNAKLTLKDGREGSKLNYDVISKGKRQSYNISSDIFLKDENYYKKDIYAVIEQDSNSKNTIYNIMYGSGDASNTKLLGNNIVNIENLYVGEKGKESSNTKIFNFINHEKSELYISISTKFCKSKVTINDTQKNEDYNHFYSVPIGSHKVKIYLINDGNLCKVGFEQEVILFAYNQNQNVLLSENTLINTTISKKTSFIHLFKPNQNSNSDNSLNIEIERLDANALSLSYELKKISFSRSTRNPSDISSKKIITKTIKYISNNQINKMCGQLNQNEVCSLIITFIPASSSKFSFILSKNSIYYSKNLSNKTLIDSVNSKNDKYFYIDINKSYNIRLLINSYGQDLKYKYQVESQMQEDNKILPLDSTYSEGSNFHQIIISKEIFSKCTTFCRLYIGIGVFEGNSKKETSSLFSIGYQYYDDNIFSDINLPLNYFTQFTFDGLEEVNYILNPFEGDDFIFELYVIKQNEKDESEVTASISGSLSLTSSIGKKVQKLNAGKYIVNIIPTKGNNKSTFKFRVSSVGKSLQIIPMISSFGEKCSGKCYYLLDDLSSEELSFDIENDNKKYVYFYIPENENSVIFTKVLAYNESYSISDNYDKTSDDKMKRTNWLQIPISFNEHSVLIKIENAKELTLCSTNYNKPNTVTLNYGEKRIFSIQRKKLDNITFYINKSKDSNVKIKLHAIKGNGIFTFKKEIYPLGFENAYKEDISIIIVDETNIQLIAINEKNGVVDEDDDFVFTIEYTIDIAKQLLYEINYDKINSFKFYQNKKINEIDFYLNFEGREANDLNMNMKIYSYEAIYNINSYFVNNDFIQKKKKDSNFQPDNNYNSTGKIKTYIQGGKTKTKYNNLTFAKLEISSNILKQQKANYTFIYIIFKLKEINNNICNVKIDLYPYNINNMNTPLARNHLFIQKIPSNSENYKLFLSKSDIYYKESVKIDLVYPLQNNYYIAHTDDLNFNPKDNEENLIIEKKKLFGKDEINLYIDSNSNKKNILLNIIPEYTEEIKDASFIFSYKNTKNEEAGVIYLMPTNLFEVSGNSKNLNYTIHAPAPLLTGNTLLIIRIYEKDDIQHLIKLDKEGNYLPLYLLFSDYKPMFTQYELLDSIDRFNSKWTTINNIKHGGDLYLTAICVVEDNEREIYFAYKGIQKDVKNAGLLQDLLDYMKDHIFASIIILIVIIMILGMLINICRAERKGGRLSSVRVDVEGKLMEDKTD